MNFNKTVLTATVFICLACGCSRRCASVLPESTRMALEQLAPEGGDGVKEYYYSDGQLKEQVKWISYRPVEFLYFDKDGRHLMTSIVEGGKSVQLSINDQGQIIEIYLTRGYEKHGPCFAIEDGAKIIRIDRYEFGKISAD